MEGCPLVALGSDAARQGSDVKASFEDGIKAHLEALSQMIAGAGDKEVKDKAMAVLSTMVGALVLARAVNDPRLANEFLQAAAKSVRMQVPSRNAGRHK